jgi:hypothetical protein
MLKQISFVRKNKFLPPAAVVLLILCWVLAFDKTYEAIRINRELQSQMPGEEDIAYNPNHTERKLAALNKILKSYQINESDWSNQLWMRASAISAKYQVGIDYTLTKVSADKDTTQIGLAENLVCYGDYLQLVRIVDTLEKIQGIGRVSALQIKAPKEDATGERAKQCMMKIAFRGFNK